MQDTKLNSPKLAVKVHLEEDEIEGGWLTVSDNGIGMTASIIKKYFLRAGASFRRSDAWKNFHENSAGKSRVLRSGRFGIGILAAFLLGDRLEVETRHLTSPIDVGIRFSCAIDDTEIELQRISIADIGTTIRVRLSKETFDHLNQTKREWDWYHLTKPPVERKVTERNNRELKTSNLKTGFYVPEMGSNLPANWHRIQYSEYEDIHWHYPLDNERETLICNGIEVGRWNVWPSNIDKEFEPLFSLNMPMLSVFDPDGKLPLNLARSQLARILPFERELLEDMCRDFIEYLLINSPTVTPASSHHWKNLLELPYPGKQRTYGSTPYLWFTPEGLSLKTKWFLHNASPKNLYIAPFLLDLELIPRGHRNVYFSTFNSYSGSNLGTFDAWIRFVLTGTGGQYQKKDWLYGINTYGRRVLLSSMYEDRIKQRVLSPRLLKTVVEEWRNKDWIILSTKNCPKPSINFQCFAEELSPSMFTALGEWYIKSIPIDEEEPVIVQVWRKIIGEPVIPFSLEERRKRFLVNAFGRLSRYAFKE